MGDPPPRDHPVDGSGSDDLAGAETVPMMDLAAIDIGDGGEADMRVRAHVACGTGDDLQRPELIEEDERPDHLALRRGQHTSDEGVDVNGPGHDQSFDRIHADRVRRAGGEQWVPAHDALLLRRSYSKLAAPLSRHSPDAASDDGQYAGIDDILKRIVGSIVPRRARGVSNGRRAVNSVQSGAAEGPSNRDHAAELKVRSPPLRDGQADRQHGSRRTRFDPRSE